MRNNEFDSFGELFRQRLEGHQVPVDVGDWGEIERRLNHQNRNKSVWWWRLGVTVAAAACFAAAMVLFMPTDLKNDEPTEVAVGTEISVEQKAMKNETLLAEVALKGHSQQHGATPYEQEVSQNVSKALKGRNQENVALSGLNEIEQISDTGRCPVLMMARLSALDEHHQDQPAEKNELLAATSELETPSETVTTLESTPTSEKEIPEPDISLIKTFDLPNTKDKNKWLLAAAFGVGGNASSPELQKSYDMSEKSLGLSGDGNRYAVLMSGSVPSFNDMQRESFTNISHSLPFSSGITARKMFGNKVGLESGLVYTFLSSRFDWTNWGQSYSAHQTLHYLGIPVNLIVYFGDSKSKSWQFYFLGGFMLEKGLRAIYRQEEKWGNRIHTTTVRHSIDGVQWSLNGSLGVSYKLEKHWSIHFEPRLGYSFDDDQPVSVRTEHPVYFGVNLGLNYKL